MAEDEMLFEKKKRKEKKLCTRATVGVCLMDIRGSNQRLKTAKTEGQRNHNSLGTQFVETWPNF
ncbi:unnamed protein product [Prunus armeniaca]|uniref:Uncharacterized protein n=1 Tax=Prunus armeniaca TaxID=36596 RepID=A0A6J5WQ30_PRUAR|nr:unnamed protein product [Prunus armeniaca]